MPPVKSNPIKVSQPLATTVKKKKYFFKSSTNTNLTKNPVLKEQLEAKRPKNVARLPTKAGEASSNWKTLSMQIKPVQSKGRLLYLERKKKEAAKKDEESSEGIVAYKKTSEDLDVWFDDVDPILLDSQNNCVTSTVQSGLNGKSTEYAKFFKLFPFITLSYLIFPIRLTKVLALDCEMVGIGNEGKESALARVSIVNQHGECIYDKFVLPGEEVTDYRTSFSGIRPHNLKNGIIVIIGENKAFIQLNILAIQLGIVCHEVAEILKGRILIGHGLNHDLEVLMIKHPKSNIRDTSRSVLLYNYLLN